MALQYGAPSAKPTEADPVDDSPSFGCAASAKPYEKRIRVNNGSAHSTHILNNGGLTNRCK
eukprot:11159934-Lingulodinium_polyedra.AAC.1